MLISTAMLERHIEWLAKRFAFASLDEIALHLEADRPFRRPVTAITFDDGYSDVYYHAYPLLQRKGIPAAVFVVTGLIGTGRPQIFDRFYLMLQLLQGMATWTSPAAFQPWTPWATPVRGRSELPCLYPPKKVKL